MTHHPVPARTRSGALAAVEREFVSERASALGRAGSRLQDAIATWEAAQAAPGASDRRVQPALDEVVAAAWALLVQRECAGFRIDNLDWIRRVYGLPDQALQRL